NAGLGTQQLVSGLQNTVNQITGNRAGFYAMAATLAKQEARQNIFASTFVRAVNEVGQAKIDLPYLDPIGLLDYINPNLPEGQKLITTVAGTSASPVFIPNPSYPTLT